MFTIFEEENEPLTERAKVDKLLTKVQNTTLAAAVVEISVKHRGYFLLLPLTT